AEGVEEVHIVGATEVVGVLEPQDHADLPGRLHPLQVAGAVDPQERLIVPGEEAVPEGEEAEGVAVGVEAAEPDGRVEDRDPGLADLAQVVRRERLGIAVPPRLPFPVEREEAEHVDDQGALDQPDRTRRVLLRRVGEEAIPAQIDHGREDRRAGRSSGRLQHLTAAEERGTSRHGIPHREFWHQRPRYPGPRTTRPGFAPVCRPSRTTGVPLTRTCTTPVERRCGSSKVAWSRIVSGSKTTMSAYRPSRSSPRSWIERRVATAVVIFRTASLSERTPSSRVYLPRMRG